MSIQFRCPSCQQLLSIATRKAGQEVFCPSCTTEVRVPSLDEAASGESLTAAELSIPPEVRERTAVEADDEAPQVRLKKREFTADGLDMTPMVDVTFQLLIFFMLTAAFSTQKSLETSAPQPEDEGAAQSVTLEDLASESIVVTITTDDQILVDDEPVAGLAELRDVLALKMASESKNELLIEPAYEAKHGTVVAVTSAAIDVGMQRVRRISRKDDD
ncbi:MAG: biopolymer transporter ExbD [Planctomyces sp.]|nr:biopolymer transporter ExbD [Planctomyces sp.]